MNLYWKEIKNDYREEDFCSNFETGIKEIVYIDAWLSKDDDEGEVIAKVVVTNKKEIIVIYINNVARENEYAQKIIKETVDELNEKYKIESYEEILRNIELITKLRNISDELNSIAIPSELKPYTEEISNIAKSLKI